MKRTLLYFIVSGVTLANAQTCPVIRELEPITLRFASNGGNPETSYPMIPTFWNRYYQVDETTGQIVPETCAFTGDPHITSVALCVCYVGGTHFREVTDVCDPTPCGGDLSLPQIPITNNNSTSNQWSQGATWLGGQVPDISGSISAMVNKSSVVDMDLDLPANYRLTFTEGNSSIAAGSTITDNAAIQVYPAAQLENFGTIGGPGQIFGSLVNSGILAPGSAVVPGKFTITGNYMATSTAVQQMGLVSTSQYDTLQIASDPSISSGNAVLNGALHVDLLNGFVPALNDSFRIVSFTSSTGVFASEDLPVLPAGLYWALDYNPDNVSLKIVNMVPLPLTFLNTRAFRKNKGVEVDWDTEKEMNVRYFDVGRSDDGVHFTDRSRISARTKGAGIDHYGWFDDSPAAGIDYYRIMATDLDGRVSYSPTQAITIAAVDQFSVYPNPVRRGGALQLNLPTGKIYRIGIINGLGQLLYQDAGHATGKMTIPIPFSWAQGEYLLRMISNDQVTIQKIRIF
jgi:hypothetical protein